MRIFVLTFLMFTMPLMAGCSRIELASHLGKKIAGTTSQSKGAYKVGSPYTIRGKRYYPSVDYDYNKVGVASWYGPNFHGKKTANGEIYNQNDLTAAHKTLPLPSIVRVTNLKNGKSLIVRVNDRGPYAHGRIIDMSKRAAELLGFKNQGTAKVRVQVLEAESRKVASIARNGGSTRGMEVPMNRPAYKPKNVKYVATQNQVVRSANVPMVSNAKGVFVQTGAFSTREGAMKYASALDSYGRAQVHPITVGDTQYYRVRFPAANVSSADSLLSRLVAGGHENAIIVMN